MKNEIKKVEAFDVDKALDELTAATVTALNRLNELAMSDASDAAIVKSVITSFKKSGVDTDDEEYCLDMDQLNSCIDQHINRLNSLCVVHPEVRPITNKLINIKTLLHAVIRYYDEHVI